MLEIADRFELSERIGGGTTADTYRAYDRELERDVVVRILRADADVDAAYVERFQREAEMASGIHHPNIVEVLDHGLIDGRPFLVRELVEGSTLEELAARSALPEDEARTLAEQIALAVAAAHARGVLHRDVNAGSVFVTPDGVAKVADFGMPTAPRHPAPEQARGEQIDERTDVFGVGAVLYQVLTGQPPAARPLPPRRLGRRVSKNIEAVAMRALASDPARRFATAAAMAEALRALAKPVLRPTLVPPLARVPPMPAERIPPLRPPAARIQRPPAARIQRPPAKPFPPTTAVTSARRRRLAAWPLVLIGLPLLLIALIGAFNLSRSAATPTVLSATTTPQAASAVTASPVPTSLPPVETTPQPAPEPTAEPSAAAEPPARAPAVPPPPAASASDAPVAATVRSFYELVDQRRFDEAAAQWSPRMQASYPPSTNIYGRFDRTRQLVLRGIEVVAQNPGTATVAIDLLEVLDSGVTRHWVGQWQLVWDGSRWLMDAPNLRPS